MRAMDLQDYGMTGSSGLRIPVTCSDWGSDLPHDQAEVHHLEGQGILDGTVPHLEYSACKLSMIYIG